MTNISGLSRADLRREAQTQLAEAGLVTAALDARVLAQHIWACSLTDLVAQETKPATQGEVKKFSHLVAQRLAGRSVSRLIGHREFYGLNFKLDASTLDPRADSEVLIDTCLDLFSDEPRRILDLGTGSGCLIISILSHRASWRGMAIDKSPYAVRMARINAARLGLKDRLTCRQGDWFETVSGSFDLIVSNPPYIPRADIPQLEAEVTKNDPHLALDGGGDGLVAYRHIAARATKYLKPQGRIVLEVGFDQRVSVSDLFNESGWRCEAHGTDLSGNDRCLVFARG